MDSIPLPVQAILDLFAHELADVRFADVDANALEQIAVEVKAAADIVESAELALDAARAALQEKQDSLLQHTQRALAYARVYAESDEAMSARLETIALPRAARRARAGSETLVLSAAPESRARVRGRSRKAPCTEPMLNGVTLTGE
jgi:hypothetical protein